MSLSIPQIDEVLRNTLNQYPVKTPIGRESSTIPYSKCLGTEGIRNMRVPSRPGHIKGSSLISSLGYDTALAPPCRFDCCQASAVLDKRPNKPHAVQNARTRGCGGRFRPCHVPHASDTLVGIETPRQSLTKKKYG